MGRVRVVVWVTGLVGRVRVRVMVRVKVRVSR